MALSCCCKFVPVVHSNARLRSYLVQGSTVLALVLMSFVKAMPRGQKFFNACLSSTALFMLKCLDKWEWGVIVTRIFIGGGICCLSFLDIGSSKPIFDSQGKLTDCIIWVITVGPRHLLCVCTDNLTLTILH